MLNTAFGLATLGIMKVTGAIGQKFGAALMTGLIGGAVLGPVFQKHISSSWHSFTNHNLTKGVLNAVGDAYEGSAHALGQFVVHTSKFGNWASGGILTPGAVTTGLGSALAAASLVFAVSTMLPGADICRAPATFIIPNVASPNAVLSHC